MLDTNVLIDLQKRNRSIFEKLSVLQDGDVGISSMVELEFLAGLVDEPGDSKSYQMAMMILDSIRIYPFDSAAAQQAAKLKALNKKAFTDDTLIAAHAISMGRVLVTNNTKDFAKIPGLKLDNWSK